MAHRVVGVGVLLSLGGAGQLWAAPVAAAPPAERTYYLQYEPPSRCPDRAALASAIEARAPGAVMRPPDEAVVTFRVELDGDGSGVLWLNLPELSSRRELAPAPCADVVASIALIAAMVLETDASERAATARAWFEPVELPTASRPSVPVPIAVWPPPPLPAAIDYGRPAAANEPPRGASWHVALVGSALSESAAASPTAWGLGAGVAAWRGAPTSWWSPRVELDGLTTLAATEHSALGDAELRLVAARLQLCPLQIPVTSRTRLVPCLAGDWGALRARGAGETRNPETATMPWLAAGVSLTWQVSLFRNWGLEAAISGRRLSRHDRFIFRPDFLAYQVPTWSLGAVLGISYSLL